MLPLLSPENLYHMSREFQDRRGSRRDTRHVSSLDLHELDGARNALRPDPVWMAIRRTAEWIGRLSNPRTATAGPERATSGTGKGDPAPDTGRVASGC